MIDIVPLSDEYQLSIGDIISFVSSHKYNIVKSAKVVGLEDFYKNWEGDDVKGICVLVIDRSNEYYSIIKKSDIRVTLSDMRNNKINKIL